MLTCIAKCGTAEVSKAMKKKPDLLQWVIEWQWLASRQLQTDENWNDNKKMRCGLYGIKGATFYLLELELGENTNHYQICGTERIHGQSFSASAYIAAAVLAKCPGRVWLMRLYSYEK